MGGKGRGLGSIGDLLKTVGTRVNVKVGKDEGIGAGAKKIPMIFSAKKITVKNPVTKINWLVDEYIKLLNEVQQRCQLALASTSSPRSRATCRRVVCSRWTVSRARLATSCSSTLTLSVSPPSSLTSKVSRAH